MRGQGTSPKHTVVIVATLCLGCAFAVGCTQSDSPALTVSVADSAEILITTIEGELQELREWRVAAEDQLAIRGSDHPQLGAVGEVDFLSDGRLVVEDNQTRELHLFGADGQYVRLLGRRGDGPGEFRRITEVTIGVGDSIYVYDRRQDRLSVLHPQDGFIRSVGFLRVSAGLVEAAPPPLDVWALGSDRLVMHRSSPYDATLLSRPFPRRDQRAVLLSAHDGDGESVSAIVRFPGSYSVESPEADAPGPFSNEPVVAVGAQRVVHGSGVQYELTLRNEEFEAVGHVRWLGREEPLTQEEFEEEREAYRAMLMGFASGRSDLVNPIIDAQFTPELAPDVRPALGPVFIDDRGQIWVSRFEPRRLGSGWHVLDPEGRPIARVSIPEESKLVAVRSDRVALMVRNDLDVEELFVRTIIH